MHQFGGIFAATSQCAKLNFWPVFNWLVIPAWPHLFLGTNAFGRIQPVANPMSGRTACLLRVDAIRKIE